MELLPELQPKCRIRYGIRDVSYLKHVPEGCNSGQVWWTILFQLLKASSFVGFLGGLSLHLNHLIAERMSTHYWQFGTLPIGIFLSNLVSGQLETSLMTSYDNFWRLHGCLSILAKIRCLQKIKVFLMKERRGFNVTSGVLGSQITRLYDGTIFGGGAMHLRGSRGLSKKLKLKNYIFRHICNSLKGIWHLLISSRISP